MVKQFFREALIIILILISISLDSMEYSVGGMWVGTVYIRGDGIIEPASAPIKAIDNHTYIMLGDITSDTYGIVVERSNIVINGNGHTLKGSGKQYSVGIKIFKCSNVTIENITIKNFYYGISIADSSNNTIVNSRVNSNKIGLIIMGSGNAIKKNNIIGNYRGIKVHGAKNYIYENKIINNLPIGIWFYKTKDNTLEKNILTNNSDGIKMYFSSYNQITGNTVSGNYYAINMDLSHHNNFTNNTINWNVNGFWLTNSTYNIFRDNIIANNTGFGGLLKYSSNNTLIHNDFINNYKQIKSLDSRNTWDAGYPEGGNYWSDHENIDERSGPKQDQGGSDGIADNPYIIDEQNIDNYPLANPLWSRAPPTNKQTSITNQGEDTNIWILAISLIIITIIIIIILYNYLHKRGSRSKEHG